MWPTAWYRCPECGDVEGLQRPLPLPNPCLRCCVAKEWIEPIEEWEKWQPVETAPGDECVIFCDLAGNRWIGVEPMECFDYAIGAAVAWMPLPDPPE